MSLFNELKRRNVFKVGVAYAVAAWLLLQIVDLVLENINAPDWVMQVFMLGLAVGFPIAIIIAWAFEVTPEGVKLEKNIDRSKSIANQTGQHLNRGIIMILAVAVVFLLTDRFRDEVSTEPGNNGPKLDKPITSAAPDGSNTSKSIAVLPFRDMSSAQDQAYFGEGIAEELLNALVKIEGLEVASRTSTFSLADENLDIPSIAQRLSVANILEGSIRTSGKQVRVTAQLIDVSEDIHLWSETYDGSLDDIFKIQDEITAKIITAMKIQLGGQPVAMISAGLTNNPEAYQLYLQGRHFWRQRSAASLRTAIELLNQAVELDPEFHRAWSNLAAALVNLPSYDSTVKVGASYEQAVRAADKALTIAPGNSEALAVKADAAILQCNTIEGIHLIKKAISSNPNDPTAHHWYALYLASRGNLDKALEEIQIAKKIDPLITAVLATEANILGVMGKYNQAGLLYEKAASLGFEGKSLSPLALNQAMDGDLRLLDQLNSEGVEEHQELLLLFADAMKSPAAIPAIENYLSEQPPVDFYVASEIAELLAMAGSPYLMDYLGGDRCFDVPSMVWADAFKEIRATPEFFHLMESQDIVNYWREFGWPDDCASLDQSLAECD